MAYISQEDFLSGTTSIEAIAIALGIDPSRIRHLHREGKIPKPAEKGKHGIRSTILGYCQFMRAARDDPKQQAVGEYWDEMARLTKLRADKTEIELQKLQGRVIEADQAVEVWQGYVFACKAKLLSIPSKLAHTLSPVLDPIEIQELITSAIEEALRELVTDTQFAQDAEDSEDDEPDEIKHRELARASKKRMGTATTTDSEPMGG